MKENPTKRRIIDCAIELFARKGYTETSIRELAHMAGLKGASVYNHFPSKSAIMEYIISEYVKTNSGNLTEEIITKRIMANPTPEGIMDCLTLSYPEGEEAYYMRVLCVIYQEQHRNDVVRHYIKENINYMEACVRHIVGALIKAGAIRQGTDPDFWMKTASCLFYAFSSRAVLGIGDLSPDFQGAGLIGSLKILFEMLCDTHKK